MHRFSSFFYTCFNLLVSIFFIATSAEAHCTTAFARTNPQVTSHYSFGYQSGSRAESRSFRQTFTDRTGRPFASAPPPFVESQREPFLQSYPPAVREQARLLFEVEYISNLLNSGNSLSAKAHIIELEEQGIVQSGAILRIETDLGDGLGEVNTSVLQAYIRLLKLRAEMIQIGEFNQQYVDYLIEYASIFGADEIFDDLWRFLPVLDDGALDAAGAATIRYAGMPRWQRINALSELAGVFSVDTEASPENADLYLDADGVKILRFSVDGGGMLPPRILGGGECHHNYLQRHSAIAQRRESDEFTLASIILNEDGEYAIEISREYEFLEGRNHFVVSEESVQSMATTGTPDSESSELTRLMQSLHQANKALVFTAHPLTDTNGPQLSGMQLFTHAIQRAYPENDVYIDAPAEDLAEYVSRLRQESIQSDQLAVILDYNTFGVGLQGEFFEAAEEWAEVLGPENVILYSGSLERAPSNLRGVIVITGRTDEALRSFVRELGEKGYLENKFIVLESCGEPLSAGLVAEINEKYNAAGTFHYRGQIEASYAIEHAEEIISSVSNDNPSLPFGRTVINGLLGLVPSVRIPTEGFWTICDALIEGTDYA